MTAPDLARRADAGRFCHEAFLHRGDAEFLDGALPFIEGGLARGETVLAVVTTPKVALLWKALGADARRIQLADMSQLGRNPTRIISVWNQLLAGEAANGRAVRGLGEPAWPGRGQPELDECRRHESLLNVAFARWPNFWLVCPYDTAALPPGVVADAYDTHPTVHRDGRRHPSGTYRPPEGSRSVLDGPLPEPDRAADQVEEIAIGPHRVAEARRFAAERAATAGLGRDRIQDTMLAVSELVTNTMRHGGGRGVLRIWREGPALVADVRDGGQIRDPLVGRVPPRPGQLGGRGLWLVNEVCDLVQLRSSAAGTVVRVHVRDR